MDLVTRRMHPFNFICHLSRYKASLLQGLIHISHITCMTYVNCRTSKNTFGIQVLLRYVKHFVSWLIKISYFLCLRVCRQETSCPQDDVFPKMCYLRVNGEYTPLPVRKLQQDKQLFINIVCRAITHNSLKKLVTSLLAGL